MAQKVLLRAAAGASGAEQPARLAVGLDARSVSDTAACTELSILESASEAGNTCCSCIETIPVAEAASTRTCGSGALAPYLQIQAASAV